MKFRWMAVVLAVLLSVILMPFFVGAQNEVDDCDAAAIAEELAVLVDELAEALDVSVIA